MHKADDLFHCQNENRKWQSFREYRGRGFHAVQYSQEASYVQSFWPNLVFWHFSFLVVLTQRSRKNIFDIYLFRDPSTYTKYTYRWGVWYGGKEI